MIGNLGIILSMGRYLYYAEGNLVDMCNEQPEKDRNNGGTKGLQVTIALLPALISAVYFAYKYIQMNAISSSYLPVYDVGVYLIYALGIFIFSLLFYVLLSGYSTEVPDDDGQVQLNAGASAIYKFGFSAPFLVFLAILLTTLVPFINSIFRADIVFFIVFFIFIIFAYGRDFINSKFKHPKISLLIVSICILLYQIFEIYKYAPISLLLILSLCLIIANKIFLYRYQNAVVMLVIALVFLSLSMAFVPFPHGHVTINMGSTHYMSGEQILVLVEVTGPDTGLSVNLSNITNDNNLSQRAFIEKLEPYPNKTIKSNNSLIGYSLSSGEYIVFINTTNLSPGYYKLGSTRTYKNGASTKYNLSNAKGFYLSDNNIHISQAAVATPFYNN